MEGDSELVCLCTAVLLEEMTSMSYYLNKCWSIVSNASENAERPRHWPFTEGDVRLERVPFVVRRNLSLLLLMVVRSWTNWSINILPVKMYFLLSIPGHNFTGPCHGKMQCPDSLLYYIIFTVDIIAVSIGIVRFNFSKLFQPLYQDQLNPC